MNSSGAIAAWTLAITLALTGCVYWLLPYFPWWAYLLFGMLVAGTMYDQLLKVAANEKIIDRGDWPNREPPNRP